MIFKKALILAPHTDDGELAFGASIHKMLEDGTQVYYVAFSTCRDSLPDHMAQDTLEIEVRNALRILGMPEANLILCNFQVRDFPNQRQEILQKMVNLKNKIEPDVVFMPSSVDIHQDHQVIHNEGLRAFKSSTLLGYEMPWNNINFTASAFIKVNSLNLEVKLAALKEYKSQQNRTYLNKEFINGLAKVRGVQAGSEYAEAFEAIRIVID